MNFKDHTVKFDVHLDSMDIDPKEVIMTVYAALEEKGYNPINQIVGYLLSGDPAYIPRHNNARSLIRKLERDEIIEELVRAYLSQHQEGQTDVRILGLDVGDKRIGVSISDEMGWTAQGLEVITRQGDEAQDLERITALMKEYNVEKVIVGLPKNMNGTIGPRGELCKAFALHLEEVSGVPIQMWDERLTTMAAERTLIEADISRKKRKQVVDKLAAVMILQGYLDSQK